MKVYCIHHHQAGNKHDWLPEIQEIWEIQPDKIFCFCMEEQDAYYILDELFRKLQPYLTSRQQQVHLIMPSVSAPPPWPWIRAETSAGYFLWGGREQVKYIQQHMVDPDSLHSIYPHIRYGNPDKLFVSYNNNPHYHRCLMVDYLAKHRLLRHGVVTFLQPDDTQTPNNTAYQWQWHDGSRMTDSWEVDIDSMDSQTMAATLVKGYRRGIIDLVLETRYEPNEFFITEKTIKPIATLKPFLALSCQGYNTEYLRDRLGYQLYDEVFDYSFDSAEDIHDRVRGVIQNLENLQDFLETHGVQELYRRLIPKLYYNQYNTYRLYFDRDFTVPQSLRFLSETADWELLGAGAAESTLLAHMHEMRWLSKDPNIKFRNLV